MNLDGSDSIPLWLLYENEIEGGGAPQPAPGVRWLPHQNVKAEKHRVMLLPDSAGGLAAAVGGLGRRQGELSLWHAAGLVERLPCRRFRLAQEFTSEEATQLCLGFAYGGYRFDRYRPARSDAASIEAAPNADVRYVAVAAESLRMARDWINTPAQDLGPSELAAAARRLAERHQAAYHEWGGEGLLAANFPAFHAVGRASSEAPRLVELRWAPRTGESYPRLTLVGKGVCFDSGGLDIKSGTGMALMKKDMGGAAVVLGLAHLLMSTGVRADLRVLVPAVENAVSGNAH